MSGVRVFPESEEMLIGGAGFGGVVLHDLRSGDLEMRQSADSAVQHNSAVVDNFLELGSSFATLVCGKICLAAH